MAHVEHAEELRVGAVGPLSGRDTGVSPAFVFSRAGGRAAGRLGGEAMEHVTGGKNRPLQKTRVRKAAWTKARRKAFLEALAASCNVSWAARSVGLDHATPYWLRARDPAFADKWREALAIGYERLEALLLSRALGDPNDFDIEAEMPARLPEGGDTCGAPATAKTGAAASQAPDIQLAMWLLDRHRGQAKGTGSRSMLVKRASVEETEAALRKQLDAIARQREGGK
jgi:hypothetical protein